MHNVGIIVRTYNEEKFLTRTLDALMGQTEQSFEIILVDSGSTDSTVEIARCYNRVEIIQIPKKDFTYGRALNIGIAATGDRVKYIAMLSAHGIPCNENWLSELLVPLLREPLVVGVYGKQIPLPEHIANPVVRALSFEAYPESYGDEPFITNNSFFFSNANCLIRFDSWVKFKFNESLSGSEDQLWAKAVIESGGWLAYQPAAAVFHSHADTYHSYFVRRYREEKSLRIICPSEYPMIKKRYCLYRLRNFFIVYVLDILRYRSLNGIHWDQFRIKAVNLLATYKGRKDEE